MTAKTGDAQAAAKQLEAFFLRQLLAEARPQGVGLVDGGFAGDTFKQMFDEAIADKMSAAGGIGLAQMFARQLGDPGAKPEIQRASAAAPAAKPAYPRVDSAAPHSVGDLPTVLAPDLATDLDAPHFVLPVAARASSGYGLRTDPVRGGQVNHPGIDLAAHAGSTVSAAAPGTVVHAGPAGTYGNLVTVRHPDGFETRYAHLSAIDVKVGDQVSAGQDVGKVGSTGYSTGPHLHFEIRRNGVAIDPSSHLPLNRSPVRTTR